MEENDLLDKVWSEFSYAPRAIASLLNMLDAENRILDLYGEQDTELLAQGISTRIALEKSFTKMYKIPARPLRGLFDSIMQVWERIPEPFFGEQLLIGVLTRALYRLGYIDGEQGIGLAHSSYLEPKNPLREEEKIFPDPFLAKVQRMLVPIFHQGYAQGRAEKTLREADPSFLIRIEPQIRSIGSIGRTHAEKVEAVEKALGSLGHGLYSELPSPEYVTSLEKYLKGRKLQLREQLARDELLRLNGDEPLDLTSVLNLARAVGRETRNLHSQSDKEKLQWQRIATEDLLDELFMLLSLHGISAETLAPLTAFSWEEAFQPLEDLENDPDLVDVNQRDVSKAVVSALTVPPEFGRLDAVPALGLEELLGSSAEEEKTSSHENGTSDLHSNSANNIRRYQSFLFKSWELPVECRDDSLAASSWLFLSPKMDQPDFIDEKSLEEKLKTFKLFDTHLLKLQEERAEAKYPLEPFALAHELSRLSKLILDVLEPGTKIRLEAESEIVSRCEAKEKEVAERWLAQYRREANRKPSSEEWNHELFISRSRVRILDHSLEVVAARDARGLLAKHIQFWSYMDTPPRILQKSLPDTFRQALTKAAREALALQQPAPLYYTRVQRALLPVCLDWCAKEMALVHSLKKIEPWASLEIRKPVP